MRMIGLQLGSNFPEETGSKYEYINNDDAQRPSHNIECKLDVCKKQDSTEHELHKDNPEGIGHKIWVNFSIDPTIIAQYSEDAKQYND